MTFKKCSIRGNFYGENLPLSKQIRFPDENEQFVWYDQTLIDAINDKDNEDVQHFFRLLALCHTVMTEEKNGQILYQAQSPDENALVSAARAFGFTFLVNLSKESRLQSLLLP